MAYSREQLVERAQQTVERLLAALEGERLVPRFVDSYVMGFDRPGLKASPLRYRELLTTVSRECLLAMVAKTGRSGIPLVSRHDCTPRPRKLV